MKMLLVVLLISALFSSPIPVPSPPNVAFRGTEFTLRVQLRSQSGNPVGNATILFFHETRNEFLGTAITNSSGFTQFAWQIPATHDLGPVMLNATFRGDPERYLLPSMVLIPMTIFGRLQNIVSIKDSEGNQIGSVINMGQQLFFHIVIQESNTPIEGVSVQLIFESNEIVTEGITSQNGSVILNYSLNQATSSRVTFTIRSLNHGFYNGTESSYQLTIGKTSTFFVGLPAFWHLIDGYFINGQLCNESGEGISNASIELLHETETLLSTVRTNLEGDFSFNLLDIIESIQNSRFFIIRFNGSIEHSATEAIIGIIPSTNVNPFIHIIEILSSLGLLPFIQQFGIISLCCMTIGTTFITVKMKRSTRRIVSH